MPAGPRVVVAAAAAAIALAAVSFAQTPAIAITAVVNDASQDTRLCPGARVYIRGSNLIAGPPSATVVTVGGRTALPMGSLVDGSLVVQIPPELAPGQWPVVANRGGVVSNTFMVSLGDLAPSLYPEIRTDTGFAGTSAFPLFIAPGEVIQVWGLCMGPTNPPLMSATNQQRLPLVTLPTATIGGLPTETLEGFHAGQGVYVMRVRVPRDMPDGPAPIVLRVGAAQASNARAVPISNRPIVRRVFNSAKLDEIELSPGAIASIRAENLGEVDQLSGFPATAFQGISVTFDGIPAPIYHLAASARQINVQVPFELEPPLQAIVRVRSAAGEGNAWPAIILPFSPGIYRVSHSTFPRNAAVLFANTAWRVMPTALARALGIPDSCRGLPPEAICGQPALPGELVQIYATGLGKATPNGDPNARPIGTGEIPPPDGRPIYHTLQQPIVGIGEKLAGVLFSGLTPGIAGLYQINIRIPDDAPVGDQVMLSLFVSEAGRGYSDHATIAVAAGR